MSRLLRYGDYAVPATASWEAERPYLVERCPYVGCAAIGQPQRREGRPRFAEPHFCRQRRAMTQGLCDLCGRPLKRTDRKISLSGAWTETAAVAGGTRLLQVEPMLHQTCAVICLGQHPTLKGCPHLIRKLGEGRLTVRQVTRWRTQYVTLEPAVVAEKVPDYKGPRDAVAGYAFIELLKWQDHPVDWLRGTKA
jgi:hypothetical protein